MLCILPNSIYFKAYIMAMKWVEFGNLLKELRTRDNLTQSQLAGLLVDKSSSEVCRWENGNRRPKQPDLLQLSIIFGEPIQTLQQKAGYTPEFNWHTSFFAPKQDEEDILVTASEPEKQELREHLRYLRFKIRILDVEQADNLKNST